VSLEEAFKEMAVQALREAIQSQVKVVVTHEPDPNTAYTLEQAAERMGISVYDLNKLRANKVIRWRKNAQKVRILERDIQTYYAWQELFMPEDELPPMPPDWEAGQVKPHRAAASRSDAKRDARGRTGKSKAA
jgi:hypothetical protein